MFPSYKLFKVSQCISCIFSFFNRAVLFVQAGTWLRVILLSAYPHIGAATRTVEGLICEVGLVCSRRYTFSTDTHALKPLLAAAIFVQFWGIKIWDLAQHESQRLALFLVHAGVEVGMLNLTLQNWCTYLKQLTLQQSKFNDFLFFILLYKIHAFFIILLTFNLYWLLIYFSR